MTQFNRPIVRKRQGFANQKPPNWGGGLDWDRINDDRLRRLDLEIARAGGAHTKEHRFHELPDAEKARILALPPAVTATDSMAKARAARKSNGGRKAGTLNYDLDRLVELYEDTPPSEIANITGVRYQTVIKYLKIAGVWDPNKYRGWEFTRKGKDNGQE